MNKKLYEKITHEKYLMMQRGFFTTTIGLKILEFISDKQDVKKLISTAGLLTWTLFIMHINGYNKWNTKTAKNLESLYNEFLNNYSKLTKDFDLKNPLEYYYMFDYMLYNGYLSKDKFYVYNEYGNIDAPNLMGAESFKDSSVCRHTSKMLSDILNKSNIEAAKLNVHSVDRKIDVQLIPASREAVRDALDFINENYDCLELEEMIDILKDAYNRGKCFKYTDICLETPRKLKKTNHAITYANMDGKNYFLDPTNRRVWYLDDDNILKNLGDKLIIVKKPFSNMSKQELKELKNKLITYKNITKEEEKEYKEKTDKLCQNNKDIFENFYKDNKEIYEEVSDGIKTIKTKIL